MYANMDMRVFMCRWISSRKCKDCHRFTKEKARTHTLTHKQAHFHTHTHTHTHTDYVSPMEASVMSPAMRSVMQSAVSNCFLARVAAAGPLLAERKSSTVFLNLRRPTSYGKKNIKDS
jgi:hypothetical protein